MGRAGRAYRRVRAVFTDKPSNFGWVIENRIAASGFPSSAAQVRWLKEHGVRSILTLTEYPIPKDFFDGTGMVYLHVPMFDHAPPSQESLDEAVALLADEVEQGNPVVVHCLAGKGRTGSVIAAYMIGRMGKGVDETLAQIRAMRPGSVERSQESAVREYGRKVKAAEKLP